MFEIRLLVEALKREWLHHGITNPWIIFRRFIVQETEEFYAENYIVNIELASSFSSRFELIFKLDIDILLYVSVEIIGLF